MKNLRGRAAKYCSECLKNKFSCDGCFTFLHKSAKMQRAHARSNARAPRCGTCARGWRCTAMCRIHTDKPLDVFSNTCKILICAMHPATREPRSHADRTGSRCASRDYRSAASRGSSDTVRGHCSNHRRQDSPRSIERQQGSSAQDNRRRFQLVAASNQAAARRAEHTCELCVRREGRRVQQAHDCAGGHRL